MWKIIKVVALLLLTGTVMSCSSDTGQYDLIDDFPIPKDAHEVKKLNLGTKNTQQLFFEINEPYPSARVLDMYRKYLGGNGWKQCTSQVQGWTSHEDASSEPHLLVHKLTDYWVNQKGGQLLILSAMYYSNDLTKNTPDNEKQRVVVWVQRVSDLKDELSRLRVICK